MQWFFKRAGEISGPVTSQQLRALAAKRIIGPADEVRRSDSEQWFRADSVKGLFDTPEASTWELTKNVFGSRRVKLQCPYCNSGLTVDLNQSGTQDICPDCSKPFIIPAAAREKAEQEELEKEDQKRQAAAEKERREVEAAIRAAEEKRANARAQAEAKAAREAAQSKPKPEPPKSVDSSPSEGGEPATLLDRIFRKLFSVAQFISLFVVAGCLLVVMGGLIAFIAASPDLEDESLDLSPVTTDAFLTDLRSAKSAEAKPVATSASSSGDTKVTPYSRLAKKYRMRSQYRDTYKEELVAFIKQLEQQNLNQREIVAAWEWFRLRCEQQEDAAARVALSNSTKRAASTATRISALSGIGIAMGSLLGFLILPLLIQLERNTR